LEARSFRKEEGRGKKEEGRRKREEGRRKNEEGIRRKNLEQADAPEAEGKSQRQEFRKGDRL